jgi:hypothetical protein
LVKELSLILKLDYFDLLVHKKQGHLVSLLAVLDIAAKAPGMWDMYN